MWEINVGFFWWGGEERVSLNRVGEGGGRKDCPCFLESRNSKPFHLKKKNKRKKLRRKGGFSWLFAHFSGKGEFIGRRKEGRGFEMGATYREGGKKKKEQPPTPPPPQYHFLQEKIG